MKTPRGTARAQRRAYTVRQSTPPPMVDADYAGYDEEVMVPKNMIVVICNVCERLLGTAERVPGDGAVHYQPCHNQGLC